MFLNPPRWSQKWEFKEVSLLSNRVTTLGRKMFQTPEERHPLSLAISTFLPVTEPLPSSSGLLEEDGKNWYSVAVL